jgi:hypothetical protein
MRTAIRTYRLIPLTLAFAVMAAGAAIGPPWWMLPGTATAKP